MTGRHCVQTAMPNTEDINDTLKLFAQSKGSAVVVDNFSNCVTAITGEGLVAVSTLEMFSMKPAPAPEPEPLPDKFSPSLSASPPAKLAAKILS